MPQHAARQDARTPPGAARSTPEIAARAAAKAAANTAVALITSSIAILLLPGLVDQMRQPLELPGAQLARGQVEQRHDRLLGRAVKECLQHVAQRRLFGFLARHGGKK